MTLASTTIIDKVEVLQDGQIQVRQAEIITKDNVEISQAYTRWVLAPNDDVSTQDAKVQAIANAVWTDEVKTAYRAMVEAIGA
jgi:putative transposon-encoded protein